MMSPGIFCRIIFGIGFFFVYLIAGSFGKCSNYGEMCTPLSRKPCCDPDLKCDFISTDRVFKCTEKERLGKFCYSPDDCHRLKFTECSEEHKCTCKKNYVTVNTTCMPNLSEFCEEDHCFPDNSHCIDNRCQCKDNYFAYGKELCLPSITIDEVEVKNISCAPTFGGFCISDNDCAVINLKCIDNKCQCRHGLTPHSRTECYQPFNRIDCQYRYQCNNMVKNSQCSASKKCACLANYHFKNGACLPNIDQHCENESCAIDNSDCVNNKCQCRYGYAHIQDACVPVNLNLTCKVDKDCQIGGDAICSKNNQCVCNKNYVVNYKTPCLIVSNNFCSFKNDCKLLNSDCIDNECKCVAKTLVSSADFCMPTKLGQFCREDIDCHRITHSKCSRNRECICQSKFAELNATSCGSFIKGYCSENEDCATTNSECIDNKCQCKPGFLSYTPKECINEHLATVCNRQKISTTAPQSDNTLKVKYLGGYCIANEFCDILNSECIDFACQCKPNYVSSSDKCIKPSLSHPCKENSDCKNIKNGKCSTDKICACIDTHFGLNEYECAPNLGGLCFNSTDCHVHASDCIDNTCQCKSNYSPVSMSQCELTSSLVSCTEALDCGEPWHLKCSNKKCVCQTNNISINKWTCLPTLGGYCWRDDQCKTLNSQCIDFHCQCSSLFVRLSNNQCVPLK